MRRPELILERELLDLLGSGRDARIAARYHGFDGGGGETLQSVGNAFGLTRERVRQIVDAASAPYEGFSPPVEVLLEFCRQAPGLRVCGDTMVAGATVNPNEVLSQIERQIVHALSQNGGTLTVSELKSACLRMGLNQTTCYLYLVHSPFILKYRHNRYGLIGSGKHLVNGVPLSKSATRAEFSEVRRTVEIPFSSTARRGYISDLGRAGT